MTLYDRIIGVYPQLTPDDFYRYVDMRDDCDGKGAYLEEWKHPTLPRPTPEQLDAAQPPLPDVEAEVVQDMQELLDKFAQSRGYDNIVSLCSYATSSHPKFKAEGTCGVTARDGYWGKGLEIKDAVQAGKRPMPTREEVLAEMPPLKWPD